jgi:hypothetical protein
MELKLFGLRGFRIRLKSLSHYLALSLGFDTTDTSMPVLLRSRSRPKILTKIPSTL